jgi:hypothetical protein
MTVCDGEDFFGVDHLIGWHRQAMIELFECLAFFLI